MHMTVTFTDPDFERASYTGRNGTGCCRGLDILGMRHGQTVMITPINSKGLASGAMIEIPVEQLLQVAECIVAAGDDIGSVVEIDNLIATEDGLGANYERSTRGQQVTEYRLLTMSERPSDKQTDCSDTIADILHFANDGPDTSAIEVLTYALLNYSAEARDKKAAIVHRFVQDMNSRMEHERDRRTTERAEEQAQGIGPYHP